MNFDQLSVARYSCRSFSGKPVEKEKINAILKAGIVAPTAKNFYPVRIFLLESEEAIQKINSVCRCIYGAKTVLVVAYDKSVACKSDLKGGDFGEMDASIVATHLMLQAQDLGVNSCWVGLFNSEEVKRVLNLPKEMTVAVLMPIGYADENGTPSERHSTYPDAEQVVSVL